jgi:hypothetical protein
MFIPFIKKLFGHRLPMSLPIPSFAAVLIPPGSPQVVTVPEDSLWVITSVSITPTDPPPTSGRVVLYVATQAPDGTQGERIAIAPLRVGAVEVVTVDHQVNSACPLIFSTEGAQIPVTVTGHTITSAALVVRPLEPKK